MTGPNLNNQETIDIIRNNEELRQRLDKLGWWVSIPLTTFPAHWLQKGEQRLDASYYATSAFRALTIVHECGLPIEKLQDLVAEVFILGRFRRVYAPDKKSGWPYLSASEALTFRPTSDRWIAQDHAPDNAEQHFAKKDWLLMSCSGSVGRVVLATERLENFFLTHDLARIVPDQNCPIGYLYAFLASWIGQELLSRDQYGSTIKHLEAHHISNIPIPLVSEAEQQKIHAQIMRAYKLRNEANHLLDQADQQLYAELALPHFKEELVPYLDYPNSQPTQGFEIPHPRAFTTSVSELNGRLDASYHIPVARTSIKLLHKGKYPVSALGQIAEAIVIPPRFKRLYVAKEFGVPFLRPSHLPHMRFHDLGYISHKTPCLNELQLKQGDVLITTDGTVGRISLATSYISGWAGSNNIGRVTYGGDDGRNGYLAAFLSSPYGFHQLNREIFGGVVDHIEGAHIAEVQIPVAPIELQREIGQPVVTAFEKKDEAASIENETIAYLENLLEGATK
ncbi:MAG: restriction endonuclease subunit S [Anaerolineales bacterium]|nr:restriction endonuclease subunit S [Anaerolineales bacterium]